MEIIGPTFQKWLYIGKSHELYRSFRVYKMETIAESLSDTIYFKHKYITMPIVTKAEEVIKAAGIKSNLPSQVPETNYEALKKVSEIFDEVGQVKVPEEKWEEPAVARVLRDMNTDATLRVKNSKKREHWLHKWKKWMRMKMG